MTSRPDMTAARRQAGVTLIELMVSLVLGLLLVLGVISVYVTNQQAARTNEGLARLQESGRIAFELMSRELRQAGGNACGAKLVANVLNSPSANWFTDFGAGAVRGIDGTVDATGIVPNGTAVGERVAGTDAVVVMSPNSADNATIVSHNPTTAVFALNTVDHGIAPGDIVIACDQQSAVILQVTTASSGSNSNVSLAVGAGATDNCTLRLGYPSSCGAGTPKTFAAGGVMARLTPGFWYIGNNPRGGRSLYRASPATREEITDGVNDMQLRFLTRNASSGNLAVNWVDPTAITDWSDAATEATVAMRIELSLVSLQNVGTDQQALRRQQVYAVTLRNRSP